MGLEHVNRRGDRYFIFQGQTKTGKPKYYCSRRMSAAGAPVEELPSDYEVYERPDNAQVSVRKVRQSRIVQAEWELVARLAEELGAVPSIVDRDRDHLIVYAADTDPKKSIAALRRLFGPSVVSEEKEYEWIVGNSGYSAVFRFTLEDGDRRLYSLDRWCFRGSVDDWVSLTEGVPLEKLARSYLPHLGEESFFELTLVF